MMYAKFIGLTAETDALIQALRRSPDESEDDIIRRVLTPSKPSVVTSAAGPSGCDLGQGARLDEGERMFLFLYKSSRDARKPEAVAEARGGHLYLNGRKIQQSKGSLVQPALKIVQNVTNNRNRHGELISLNAWDHWYVVREGRYVAVGELRDQHKITRRGRIVEVGSLDDLASL